MFDEIARLWPLTGVDEGMAIEISGTGEMLPTTFHSALQGDREGKMSVEGIGRVRSHSPDISFQGQLSLDCHCY